MVEVRVVQGGDLFMLVDKDSRRIGGAYASETACRRAHNLMDFQAMGRYAPTERKSNRFIRVLHGDVFDGDVNKAIDVILRTPRTRFERI